MLGDSELDSRERMMRALCLQESDRVPIAEYVIDLKFYQELTGKVPSLVPETFAEDLRLTHQAYKKLGYDSISVYGVEPRIEKEKFIDHDTYIDNWGAIRRKVEVPTIEAHYIDGSIRTTEEFDNFEPPSADEMVEAVKSAEKVLSEIREDTFVVAIGLEGFHIHLLMRGFERALSDYYLNPQIPEKVMNMVHAYDMTILKAMADIGVDAVMLDDDYADSKSLMIPPKLWRKFVKPTHDDFIRTFKKKGLFVMQHSDGNIAPILDDIVDSGVDALNPVQPQAMDIAWVKEHCGDKICIIGNVDCGYTLTHGTEAEIRQATRECIDNTSYGGGHILSSSNSLHWAVPLENALTMIDEGEKYGRYPIRN